MITDIIIFSWGITWSMLVFALGEATQFINFVIPNEVASSVEWFFSHINFVVIIWPEFFYHLILAFEFYLGFLITYAVFRSIMWIYAMVRGFSPVFRA